MKYFLVLLIAISLNVLAFTVGAQQAHRAVVINQFPDETYLTEIDGVPHWAVNAARAKILHDAEKAMPDYKQCEADLIESRVNLQKEKNNVQDERVQVGRIEKSYNEQSALLTECVKLHGGGKLGGLLNNPWFRFGETVARDSLLTAQVIRCRP